MKRTDALQCLAILDRCTCNSIPVEKVPKIANLIRILKKEKKATEEYFKELQKTCGIVFDEVTGKIDVEKTKDDHVRRFNKLSSEYMDQECENKFILDLSENEVYSLAGENKITMGETVALIEFAEVSQPEKTNSKPSKK